MLILVRHGQTAHNAARVLQPEDAPLSEHGMRQAERLAQRLVQLGVARVLASDLPRARMTADAVARATGVPVEHEPLLRERSFGDLRGTAYSDLRVNVFDPVYEPPGGESVETFDRRVARAWDRVGDRLSDTDGHLVVVTHGLVCRSLAEQFFRLPSGRNVPVVFANTSVTLVEREPPHEVRLLDCVAHLDGDESGEQGGAV